MKKGIVVLGLVMIFCGVCYSEEIAVTVYNGGIGVVRDVRQFRLERGTNEIKIDDVAARIDPTSVRIKVLSGEAGVVEQNFRYDLASPDKLLRRYLNGEVRLVTRQGEEITGTLLAFDSKNVVVRDTKEIMLVARETLGNIELPGDTKGLIVKPTLVWQVLSEKPMRAVFEIGYITKGMTWHAEYIAALTDEGDSIDFSGWVSVENNSGATYKDAKLKLVAGRIHTVEREITRRGFEKEAIAPQVGFGERPFFEYHVYELDRTTTLVDREVKQIQFLSERSVSVERSYEYDATKGKNVRVILTLSNTEANGLGIPLPEGKVRFYKSERGAMELIGEDLIDHTPVGKQVDFYVGDAFDISVKREMVDFKKISDAVTHETYRLEFLNSKPEEVVITVIEHQSGDWRITNSTLEYRKKAADIVEFKISVPSHQKQSFTYTVRRRR